MKKNLVLTLFAMFCYIAVGINAQALQRAQQSTGQTELAKFKQSAIPSKVSSGDTFTATTVEGVEIGFTIVDVDQMTCKVGRSDFESSTLSYDDRNYAGTLTIPSVANGYTVIGVAYHAFYDTKLTSIILPETITFIEYYAFTNSSNLVSVNIPQSVESIGENAFECTGITSVVIPEGITKIDVATFDACPNLESVVLPSSLTSICGGAFYNCSSLTSITIPEGVTLIDEYAFFGTGLTSITIPKSMMSIGNMTFSCRNLKEVIVLFEEPIEISEYTFNVPDDAVLYVPEGSKEAFASASNWNKFSTIKEIGVIENDKDKLKIDAVEIRKGKTASMDVVLQNETTDFTAYQFDLTLPAGISIATNDKGKYLVSKSERYYDDDQNLTVNLVDEATNTYRFLSYSLSSGIIEGTDGVILAVTLQAADDIEDGDYTARIQHINFTQVDGTKNQLSESEFTIAVNNILMGDPNGDGIIDVSDIVAMVNKIMGSPSDDFIDAAADLNGDGEVDVTDIVTMVNIIMSGGSSASPTKAQSTDFDALTLTDNTDGTMSLCLENGIEYVAAQFEIELLDGQILDVISMNPLRRGNHQLAVRQTEPCRYVVLSYSLNNEAFEGNSGELFRLSANQAGAVRIAKATFVMCDGKSKRFDDIQLQTTSVNSVDGITEPMDVYAATGALVKKGATSLCGLAKGVYIINNKKYIVK